jgi:predicted RecB family endonuclease
VYVDDLCRSLAPGYDYLLRNVPIYSMKRRLIGEIDVLAFKEGYYDIYEVKCSHRISKARRQVTKFRKILSRQNKVKNTFFFCGESGMLICF